LGLMPSHFGQRAAQAQPPAMGSNQQGGNNQTTGRF
jgi:hypothetical protein